MIEETSQEQGSASDCAIRKFRDACAEWAAVHADSNTVRQAAKLGHDVRTVTIEQVVDRVWREIGQPRGLAMIEGRRPFEQVRWERRENPSTRALAIRDRAVAAVELISRPRGLEAQVLPVQRVCWNGRAIEEARRNGDHRPPKDVVTAVVVRFVAPGMGDRVLIINAE